MKKVVFALIAAAIPVSLQAQRKFEWTFDSWNHPNHSVETFKDLVFTGYTDLDQNSGLYMPSFKISDAGLNGMIKFHTDFQLGMDVRLMDFTIRENNESIILAGFTQNWPYELVLAEVDFNGNFIQAALHTNQNGFGMIPHQVIWSENAQQVAVVGTYLQGPLDGSNGATVPKTAFVLGVDLNDLTVLQFDNEVDTPQGGFTDNDIYENLTEFPGGYFISGSANDPASSKQLMTVLGIDYGGGQMHSAIWDNSNSRYTGASVMYYANWDVVFLLANNSVIHQFEIGYFDPYSGTLLSGMHRHQTTSLPIGSGVDQNGFRLQETNGGEIVVGGYYTSWGSFGLPNLITPFQMVLDPSLTGVITHKLFQSNNNFDPGDYFSMIGNSVYINTPDMIVYNRDSERTFLVNPNSDIGGFDNYVSIVHDYFPCEEPLQTNYFDFQPTWISTVNNPNAPLMSNYINESPVDIKIREEPLCEWAAKDLAGTAAGGATLFPNPASDRLSIALEDAEIMIVSVYDLNGSLIAEFRPGAVSATTVDISNLSAGTYLIDITDAEGTVRRDKFVKE